MIDNFALALSHALLALAAWRLMLRADLDQDPQDSAEAEAKPAAAPPTIAEKLAARKQAGRG